MEIPNLDRIFRFPLFKGSSLKAEYEALKADIAEKEGDVERLKSRLNKDWKLVCELESQGNLEEARERRNQASRTEEQLNEAKSDLQELREGRQSIRERLKAKIKKLEELAESGSRRRAVHESVAVHTSMECSGELEAIQRCLSERQNPVSGGPDWELTEEEAQQARDAMRHVSARRFKLSVSPVLGPNSIVGS